MSIIRRKTQYGNSTDCPRRELTILFHYSDQRKLSYRHVGRREVRCTKTFRDVGNDTR